MDEKELYVHEGEEIRIKGLIFKFGILSDSIGDHPIWENEKYRIFASLVLDGERGLFIDIDELEVYKHLKESPATFEEYKIKCMEVISELLACEISDFEPHIIKQVRKSGDIYVGREHVGKKAYVYFLRDA